jgi:hypothetical protein
MFLRASRSVSVRQFPMIVINGGTAVFRQFRKKIVGAPLRCERAD